MNHVPKAIFLSLLLTLGTVSLFSPKVITITGSDFASGRLTLDPATTEVGWSGRVRLVIGDTKVKSFKILRKSDNNPWMERPERDYATTITLWTCSFRNQDWSYGIKWIDSATNTERPQYDPVISIRPSRPFNFTFVMILLAFLAGILLLRSQVKKIRAKKTTT